MLNNRIDKKVLEEVLVLSLGHLQGRVANLAVHPGRGARLYHVLDTFSLDGSLEPHQGRGGRIHARGVPVASF